MSQWYSKVKQVFRRYFIAGLVVLVPVGATFSLVRFILNLADRIVNVKSGKFLFFVPENQVPVWIKEFPVPGFGLLLLVLVILFIGILTRNFVGTKLLQAGDDFLNNIPLVRKIYYTVKQIVETVVNQQSDSFRRVVLIEYPRKGIYSLAFVTGQTSGDIPRKLQKRLLNVFIPTTPNPTSGFYLIVPEEEVIAIDIEIEHAFKMIISAGIVVEDGERTARLPA